MAARLNVRFLLILVIVVGSLAAAGAAYYVLVVSKDASRHVEKAQEFLDAGDPRKAKYQLVRAISKEPANLEYLAMLETAITSIRPEAFSDARELANEYASLLVHAATHHPTNADLHLRAIGELATAARQAGFGGYWREVENVAEDMLINLPEEDPTYVDGLYYRAASRFAPARRAEVADRDLEEAEEDVAAFLAARPDSDAGWGLLLRRRLDQLEEYRLNRQTTREAEAWVAVERALEEAKQKVGIDGIETQLAELRYLDALHRRDPESVDPARAAALADRIARFAEQSDEEWLVRATVMAIEGLDWVPARPELAPIIEAYLERHPDSLEQRIDLGLVRLAANDLEGAEEAAVAVLDSEPLPAGFASLLRFDLQRRAARLLLDVEAFRWFAAADDEKTERADAVKSARDRLDLLVDPAQKAGDPALIYAEGLVAFVTADYRTAAAQFDRLIREGLFETPQTLMYASISLERIGQLGLARQRVEEAMALFPSDRFVITTRTRLLVRLREYEEALRTVEQALVSRPDDPQFLAMAADVRRRLGAEQADLSGDPVVAAIAAMEAAAAEGDLDAAADAGRAALADLPDEVRLIAALARVESLAGRRDEALTLVERGLVLRPDSPAFLSLRASLEHEDPLAALLAFHETVGASEGQVGLLLALQRQVDLARRRAEERERAGDAEGAASDRDLVRRATIEEDRVRDLVAASTPDDPRYLEYRFLRALAAGDWDAAKQCVERARAVDADQAGGLVFEGRLAGAQGRNEDAVRALTQAVQRVPFNASVWSFLARAYREVGNYAESIVAFDRAFQANPNDLGTCRAYIGLLQQTSRNIRALEIVRHALRLAPEDRGLRRTWLELEASIGNAQVVLRERRRQYASEPDDEENAFALVLLLASTEPDERTILEEDGEPRFPVDSWRLMRPEAQRTEREKERGRWDQEIDRIVAALEPEDPLGAAAIRWGLLRAEIMQRRGDGAGGQRVLAEITGAQQSAEHRVIGLLCLADMQRRLGLARNASITLAQAAQISPERVEPHLYLGEMLAELGQYLPAAEAYDRVIAALPEGRGEVLVIDADRVRIGRVTVSAEALEFNAVECEIQSESLDAARSRFDRVFGGRESPNYGMKLLEASLVVAEADRALEEGRRDDADSSLRLFDRILDEAEALQPTQPRAYAFRAVRLLKDYERTGDELLLDDALRALDRAEEVAPGDRQTALTRVEVLEAKGDRQAAIAELRRTLDRDPDDSDIRNALIRALVRADRRPAAIAVVEEAVAQYRGNPRAATWRGRLGDLALAELNDPVRAAEEYRKAWDLVPSTALLGRMVDALLAKRPPDYAAALSIFQARTADLESDPDLRGWYARTLVGMGRRDAAIEQLRVAYGQYRAAIAEGRAGSTAIRGWFNAAVRGLGADAAAEIEALAMELTQGAPDPIERSGIALVWAGSGAEGASRAIELQREALAAVPEENAALRAMLLMELGGHLIRGGQETEAVTVYEQVIALQPTNSQALNNIAYILADRQGRAAEALPYAERAVELAPRQWSALDTYGWTLFLAGQVERAEKYLRRSVDRSAEASNHLHLAKVFRKQGRWNLAQLHCEQAALRNRAQDQPDEELRAEIDRLADDIRNRRGGS